MAAMTNADTLERRVEGARDGNLSCRATIGDSLTRGTLHSLQNLLYPPLNKAHWTPMDCSTVHPAVEHFTCSDEQYWCSGEH
jgi:hypothetical protein